MARDITQSMSITALVVQFLGLRAGQQRVDNTNECCCQLQPSCSACQCPEHISFSTCILKWELPEAKPQSLKHYHAKHCFSVWHLHLSSKLFILSVSHDQDFSTGTFSMQSKKYEHSTWTFCGHDFLLLSYFWFVFFSCDILVLASILLDLGC